MIALYVIGWLACGYVSGVVFTKEFNESPPLGVGILMLALGAMGLVLVAGMAAVDSERRFPWSPWSWLEKK